MKEKIFNFETISYIIVGVLTTLVDYIVFAAANELLKHMGVGTAVSVSFSTVISWLAAVAFAYALNKLVVFKSYDLRPAHVAKEAGAFFSARVLSGAISLLLMMVMTVPLAMNEYIAKIVTSVFNLIFNYAASKFFIFKK